ncbi:MAPK-interacting and spindle-stabilizing protein-like [Emydura macquarii macquarii]|uniref:MAPK-interacting and spindle-stabilizing protein-like n=1 Tax=Emydura macquarii macquarii TaxID=1129001 RepID=UPI00352AB419
MPAGLRGPGAPPASPSTLRRGTDPRGWRLDASPVLRPPAPAALSPHPSTGWPPPSVVVAEEPGAHLPHVTPAPRRGKGPPLLPPGQPELPEGRHKAHVLQQAVVKVPEGRDRSEDHPYAQVLQGLHGDMDTPPTPGSSPPPPGWRPRMPGRTPPSRTSSRPPPRLWAPPPMPVPACRSPRGARQKPGGTRPHATW